MWHFQGKGLAVFDFLYGQMGGGDWGGMKGRQEKADGIGCA